MSALPPGLEEFGERLRDAAEVSVEQERGRRRRRRTRAIALSVGAAMTTAAVGAGAVKLVDGEGEPIKPDPGGHDPAPPPKDRTVVAASATPDPRGGPPWVVRVYTDTGGKTCVMVGRLRNGEFGQVQSGEFRRFPASAPGTCAAAGATGPVMAVQRNGTASTVVFGAGVDDAAPVEVRFHATRRRVQAHGLGAFVAVFAGADPDGRIVVRARVDGRDVEQEF